MNSFFSEVNKRARWLPFVDFVLLHSCILKCHRKLWPKTQKQSFLSHAKSLFKGMYVLLSPEVHMELLNFISHLNVTKIKVSTFQNYSSCIHFSATSWRLRILTGVQSNMSKRVFITTFTTVHLWESLLSWGCWVLSGGAMCR